MGVSLGAGRGRGVGCCGVPVIGEVECRARGCLKTGGFDSSQHSIPIELHLPRDHSCLLKSLGAYRSATSTWRKLPAPRDGGGGSGRDLLRALTS